MLIRETLVSVLDQPANSPAPEPEVQHHQQPAWERSQQQSHALILTGVRRCGKSTLQSHIRQSVKGKAVTLNLEDTRLCGFGPEDFAPLIAVLDEHNLEAAIYLDEV